MTTQHTPTPWTQGNWEAFEHAQPYADHVYDAMGNAVFQVVPANGSDDAAALTATIVRACNAHEELLAVVRIAKRLLDVEHERALAGYGDERAAQILAERAQVLAALAKAEGK